jgi:hypothetical protein
VKFALIFVSYFATKNYLTMPNYILSLIGMAAIVIVSSIVCGYLIYKNEQDHVDRNIK